MNKILFNSLFAVNVFGLDQLDGLALNNNNNNIIPTTTTTKGKAQPNKGNRSNKSITAQQVKQQQQPQLDVEPMSTTPPPSAAAAALAPAPATATVAANTTATFASSSLLRPQSNTAAVGIDGELATVVNIDVFDDQLSLSSISTNSRLSLEGPPSQSSPPLSLSNGGLLDTNLMHFSESAAAVTVVADGHDNDDDDDDDDEDVGDGRAAGRRHFDGSDIMPRL